MKSGVLGKFASAALCALMLAGCGTDSAGKVTESLESITGLPNSGVAGPSTSSISPVAFIPRAQFATGNTVEALGMPGMSDSERASFQRGLSFFITERTPANGLGPLFNQNRCLGCHTNTENLPFPDARPATPTARAFRLGPTDHNAITKFNQPPTAAFTLFADLLPDGTVDPLAQFGGPIRHIQATGSCQIEQIPPTAIDPNLVGGIDPDTGVTPAGARRGQGERAAPPYIGRGLMESIFQGTLQTFADPQDTRADTSTLLPANPAGGGDFISGRVNLNSPNGAFIGADPVVRVARFGLRGQGPTLLQFMIGGTQGEIGLTSPFRPEEQPNPQNPNQFCDEAPDPEITDEDVKDLRAFIRLIGIPAPDARLFENPPVSAGAADIQAGARLFGMDVDAFRFRLTGVGPDGTGDQRQFAMAPDRQLNCVACHVPLMPTGTSPAEVGGQLLSNKYIPLFSDLLIHDMGEVPPGRSNPIPPPPSQEISRNLSDVAIPGQGLAGPNEWRTPPLMGMGIIGPPFMHDARVFLNPATPATTVYSNFNGANQPLVITNVDEAILAAIELHDLPAPDLGLDQNIFPPAGSPDRSEARLVMQRWRALTPTQQQQVVEFLKSL